LHNDNKDKLDQIDKIIINTHESAIRIIDKKGPLNNPADRDHCLQYMVAIGLMTGDLKAENYEDSLADANPRIDELRDMMEVQEEKQYSVDYLDPDKRSIANDMQLVFKDGSKSEKIIVHYPIGHRERREEGIPVLVRKYEMAMSKFYDNDQFEKQKALIHDRDTVAEMDIEAFMDHFVKK
jgi:2-methylcitrate dehydratase